jgi:uncharacterized protein (TIGR03083 family)
VQHETYLTHIGHDVDRVVAAIAAGPLDAPVASCPGWGVRQLVEHLGAVHRWATSAIVTGQRPAGGGGGAPDDAGLGDWFREGADGLLQALATTDPDADTWHPFPGELKVWLWRRRQAHETAVHRWDVEHAVGAAATLDAELSADGVNEFAEVLLPRVLSREKVVPPTTRLGLRATDADRAWVLHGDGDLLRVTHHDGPTDGALEGSAEALLLVLMGRAEHSAVATTGDAAVVEAWMGLPGL